MSEYYHKPVLENDSQAQEALLDTTELLRDQAETRSRTTQEAFGKVALRSLELMRDASDSYHAHETLVKEHKPGHEAILASERLTALYGVQERPEKYEARKKYDLFDSQELFEQSEAVVEDLLETDPAFNMTLAASANETNARQIVEAVRSDQDVRLRVAGYLTDKLDFIAKEFPDLLPAHVQSHGNKRINANESAVKQYSSRERVVYRALEKISGVAVQDQYQSASDLLLNRA